MGDLIKAVIFFVVCMGLLALAAALLRRLDVRKPGWRASLPPYRLKDRLLSPGEAAFLSSLRAALTRTQGLVPGSGTIPTVYAMVRMCDVLEVDVNRSRQQEGWRTAQNRIDRKHFDFVLVDPNTTRPLLAVELDDRTHNRPDRQDRDAFVDDACDAAGLPILHVRARAPGAAYDVAALAVEIERKVVGRS